MCVTLLNWGLAKGLQSYSPFFKIIYPYFLWQSWDKGIIITTSNSSIFFVSKKWLSSCSEIDITILVHVFQKFAWLLLYVCWNKYYIFIYNHLPSIMILCYCLLLIYQTQNTTFPNISYLVDTTRCVFHDTYFLYILFQLNQRKNQKVSLSIKIIICSVG